MNIESSKIVKYLISLQRPTEMAHIFFSDVKLLTQFGFFNFLGFEKAEDLLH